MSAASVVLAARPNGTLVFEAVGDGDTLLAVRRDGAVWLVVGGGVAAQGDSLPAALESYGRTVLTQREVDDTALSPELRAALRAPT